MNDRQRNYAVDQAFEAAKVPAADRAAGKTSFETSRKEAEELGLDDAEAMGITLTEMGIPDADKMAGVARYEALQKRFETSKSTPLRHLKHAAIAAIVVVMVLVVLIVVASMANTNDPTTSRTEPPVTVHAVIDRPLDANGTPPAP